MSRFQQELKIGQIKRILAGQTPMARSIECKCDSNLTCGYCLKNAKPYFHTPTAVSLQEINKQKFKICLGREVLHRCEELIAAMIWVDKWLESHTDFNQCGENSLVWRNGLQFLTVELDS